MAALVAPDLQDPFFRKLFPKLEEQLASRIMAIADGSAAAVTEDVRSTSEKYAAQVSYIKCLNDVIELCKQLQADMYGGGEKHNE